MKCILLSEKTRKRIVRKVKPKRNDFYSFQSLNLLTGVLDEESGVILTGIYYLSESVKKSGDDFDDTGFIIIGKEHTHRVFFRTYLRGEKYRDLSSPCPEIISDEKLLAMIKYYNSTYSERAALEKESDEYKESRSSFYRNFTDMYLNRNYFKKDTSEKHDIFRPRAATHGQNKVEEKKQQEPGIIFYAAAFAIIIICIVHIINSL